MLRMTPALSGHLAMLIFSSLVAGSFSLGSLAANDMAPVALNAVRFWIAFAVAGGVALLQGKLLLVLPPGGWRFIVLGGLFSLYFVLMFEGLKTAPPVSLAAIFTLMPLMTAIIGWLILKQVTTGRMAFALVIDDRRALGHFPGRVQRVSGGRHRAGRGDLFRRLPCACGLYSAFAQAFPWRTRRTGGDLYPVFGRGVDDGHRRR